MKRDSSHVAAQRQGKARDLYTCQVCGSKHDPEGHHIFDHQYGGSASVNNIVTLCHSCHMQAHHGNLFITKF